MLRYLDAFADYNPIEDPLPEELFYSVGYLEQKALQLIPEHFSINELNAGLENLFELKNAFHHKARSRIRNENPTRKYSSIIGSKPHLYFLSAESSEKTLLPDGSEFDWSAFFAVIALASLSDYIAVHRKVSIVDPTNADLGSGTSDFEAKHKEGLLTDSLEALGYARLYKDREQRALTIGRSTSRTRIGAYHQLKNAVFQLYAKLDQETKKNDTKSANIIHEQLPEKIKLISSSENPEHQIKVWIGQYRKGTLAGMEFLTL